MKKLYSLLFIALTMLLLQGQAKAQLSDAFAKRMQTVWDSACQSLHIKGASAAVLVPGVGTWKSAYGESYAGLPIKEDMPFIINSNTKTYVSSLMLKLQEMGKVNIDDTIGTWIKNVKYVNGQITIRQLLNHTSGIYSFTENPILNDTLLAHDFTYIFQPDAALGLLEAPYFAPGKNFHYSNTNYTLAGLIIQQLTGEPLNISLRKYIFQPLTLNHTYFYPQDTTNATQPHIWSVNFTTDGSMLDMMDMGYDNNEMTSISFACGNIMQTAEDNAKFWHGLISGQIINDASMKQMRKYVPLDPSTGYGLGIFRYKYFNGRTVFSHGGTNVGIINENLVDSISGIAISVLTNQDSINNNILLSKVVSALHKVTISTRAAGISEVLPEVNIDIYPNPATDHITISADNIHTPFSLQLYDASGKVVLSRRSEGGQKLSVYFDKLPAGLYVAQVRAVNGELLCHRKIQVMQ